MNFNTRVWFWAPREINIPSWPPKNCEDVSFEAGCEITARDRSGPAHFVKG